MFFSVGNPDTFSHIFQKRIGNRSVYGYFIFFFVAIPRPHHSINQIPVIRHDQKSLGIFIKPACISNPDRIIQETDDIPFLPFVFCANNPGRLIHRQDCLFFPAYNLLFSDPDFLLRANLHSLNCFPAVYSHSSTFDQPICFSSGTYAGITDIFIQSHHFQAPR